MQHRPFYCQISPSKTPDEDRDRIATSLNQAVSPFLASGPPHGMYRGHTPGNLEQEVLNTLQNTGNNTIVIAISCHGKPDTGNFSDYCLGEK